MRGLVRRTCASCVIVLAGASVTGFATADASSAPGTRVQIVEKLAAITSALTRGDSAEKVVNFMYADNILLAESGETPVRGRKGVVKAVQDWMDSLGPGGVKACSYKIIDPVVETSREFSSFLNMTCKSNGVTTKQDMQLRLLYVWQKGPEGWQVVLESTQDGSF
jgi:ketosteroid isomerase-like protein